MVGQYLLKKKESVIDCRKYYCTNVLKIALSYFLFNWFIVTFSFIHTCRAPLSTVILCQTEPSREPLKFSPGTS